ncbi:MAG: hypothetical protein Q9209_007741 [Squamulea sp. 1 TL-2023]
MVWMLQMSFKRKIMVSILLSFGVLGVAFSVARAVALINIKNNPGSDDGTAITLWSVSEAAVAILCSCLPILRPLFKIIYESMKRSITSKKYNRLYSRRALDKKVDDEKSLEGKGHVNVTVDIV